jgi:hypothetical protein
MEDGEECEKMFISRQGFDNIIGRLKFATLRLVLPATPDNVFCCTKPATCALKHGKSMAACYMPWNACNIPDSM